MFPCYTSNFQIMETKLLLPHRFKWIGWVLSAASIFFWVVQQWVGSEWETHTFAIIVDELLGSVNYFTIVKTDIIPTLIGSLFIIGGLLIAFSREKIEDEFIAKMRLSSFMWAVLANYLILLFLMLFIYGMAFLSVMIYNMFTILVLFIIRFHYLLIKSRTGNHEE